MMTSFAFILGVVLPLVAAHGAGQKCGWTLGTAVNSGMLGVTFFGILLTPVFFFVIDRLAACASLLGRPACDSLSHLVLDISTSGSCA